MTSDDLIPSDIDINKSPGYRRHVRRVDIPEPPKIPDVGGDNNEKCEIKDIEQGVIVPYRLPPGAAATGLDAIIAELRAIERLLESHTNFLAEIKRYLSYEVPKESTNLLETQQVTRVQTLGPRGAITQDQVTDGTIPGYDEIEVWNLLSGRKAQRVWLVNDGVQGTGVGDNLFLRVSPDGKSFSPEFIMILGEIRIATDVYAIRFRSETQGITLRASEREIYPPYVTTVTNTFSTSGAENKDNFIVRNLAPPVAPAPVAAQTLPNITVPDGFALTIKANVNNPGQIFISRTDASVAANRTTLAAGDTVSLFITNANLVRTVASGIGNTIDLLVEQ